MSTPNTINQAYTALSTAVDKGAHSVRLSTDLVEALLSSHALLTLAFQEIDKKAAENAE